LLGSCVRKPELWLNSMLRSCRPVARAGRSARGSGGAGGSVWSRSAARAGRSRARMGDQSGERELGRRRGQRPRAGGEMLPPVGLAATLPVSCQRCIHLTAELALTSKRSAASRRDAPVSTASSTRSRKSKEQGFGIDRPPKIESMPPDSLIQRPEGIPRFN
jgi:hypothetical protein